MVYGALVTHYGGQVSKQLTRFCSHAISDRPIEVRACSVAMLLPKTVSSLFSDTTAQHLLTALPALNEGALSLRA